MGDCEGVHVGLFDPTRSAPMPDSLAGPSLGATMRTRRAAMCGGDVEVITLMAEDGAASHALQDEPGPVSASLCADCVAAYADRVLAVGCAVCHSKLAIGLASPDDPGFGGYCGGCAVDRASSAIRSELDAAVALAVDAAITPLREEIAELRARAPASPVPKGLDVGPDGRSPKYDRCGAELGLGFASYTVGSQRPTWNGPGWQRDPKVLALRESAPALARLVEGQRITVQVLLRDGAAVPTMNNYFYFSAQVRGMALESEGTAMELYVPATGLRYTLPIADFSSWEFGPPPSSAWPEVTRHGISRDQPLLAVEEGQSVVDASVVDPLRLRASSLQAAHARSAPAGGTKAAEPSGAAPAVRRAPPGPAARKDLAPEALDFLSRPEVRGDIDCHGSAFVAPAPTEAEAASGGGDGRWAAAGIFPPAPAAGSEASFISAQRRGAADDLAHSSSRLAAVLNTGALAARTATTTAPANPETSPQASLFATSIGPAVPAPSTGGSQPPEPVPGVTDALIHLLDSRRDGDPPVVAWYRSGRVEPHVTTVYDYSFENVRKVPGYGKMYPHKYYVVTHGRGPRFVITNHYALALFGRQEFSGSPSPHLERLNSWEDAVARCREHARVWRESLDTPVTSAARVPAGAWRTPVGGAAAAARTPASTGTFAGEVDSDDETSVISDGHFGVGEQQTTPSNSAIAEQVGQAAEATSELVGTTAGLAANMAVLAEAVAEIKLGSAAASSKVKGEVVGYSAQAGKLRQQDMAASNERERIAKAKSGIPLENTRAQAIVALRLSTGGMVNLAFGETALEAYTSMLALTADPPSRSPALAHAGCNMTAITAAYLVELRVAHSENGPEGIGCAETHFESDEAALAVKRENLSERLHVNNRLKNGRTRAPPKAMVPERWRKNRLALSKLIGSYIGENAEEPLSTLVEEEYIKSGKDGYTVQMADEVFCEVVRKWVAAGAKLLKDADVGIYMDAVDTGQLVQAHLAAHPADRVALPCPENYPTVLGDRKADDDKLWEAHKQRAIETERLLRLKEAQPSRAGQRDPPAGAADEPPAEDAADTSAPSAGGGSGGGGSGGGGGGSGGEAKATGDGTSASKRKKERAAVRQKAAEAERTAAAVKAALAEQEARHGALSGSPGGVPVSDGGRFTVPATTKAAASGKDPRGDKNLLYCRKCNGWAVKLGKQGKPFNGTIHVCPGQLDFHHGEYAENTQLHAATLANMCHLGGCLALPMTDTREKQQKAHDLLMADGKTRSYKEWKSWGTSQHFGESPHLSSMLPSVEVAPGVVLRPPDADTDATGLEQLIKANGGMSAMQRDLRADEQSLAQALSRLTDDRWLRSAYTLAGVPTPGVAATVDLGEPSEFAQRLETLMCINRSKLLSNVPDAIAGPTNGITQSNLEELSEDETLGAPSLLSAHLPAGSPIVVRSFTDDQVRAALVQALSGLITSSDPAVARAADKFLRLVTSDAQRTDVGADGARAGGGASPAPDDSLSDAAVFWRAAETSPGEPYEVRLADGSGGVWICRARDVGDTVPLNGKQRPKACVVATAARAAAGDGVQLTAGALLKQLIETARAAAVGLGPLPDAAGRLEWHVREAVHDLVKPVPHDLSVAMFEAMDPALLAAWSLKSIEVSDTSILSTRQTRFRNYTGRPLKHALLLEHKSGHRSHNHAVLLELPEALRSAEAFDAWQMRLSQASGTRESRSTARGWQLMVDDSRRLEVQQRASSRKACPLCSDGECGLRAGESSASGGGGSASEGAVTGVVGGALAAATAAKEFGRAAVLTFGTEREAGFGLCSPPKSSDATMASLRFLDDDGALIESLSGHTETMAEQLLETETIRAIAEHDAHVGAHGDDTTSPPDPPPRGPDPEASAEAFSRAGGGDELSDLGSGNGHWVAGVTAVEAALAAATVLSRAPDDYSVNWMLILAVLFNTLVVAAVTMPRAVNAWRIVWRPLAGCTHDRRRVDATRDFVGERAYSHLSYSVRHGIHTLYEGISRRRIQAPLPGARERADQFWGSSTWDLIRTGRAFILTGLAAGRLAIISSPIGATAKFAADGAMTAKVRFFHHLSKLAAGLNLNAQSDRDGHGGCFYPVVAQLVRKIMALKRRYPGARVVIDLFDVAGAFTLVDVTAADVNQFATEMPLKVEEPPSLEELTDPSTTPRTRFIIGEARAKAKTLADGAFGRVARLLTVVYLTGTFGHISLPAQYGQVAMKPIHDFHNSFTVAHPELHGAESLSSLTYVDDTVDVVMDWGFRRWISRGVAMKAFYAFLGANAFNQVKASSGYLTRRVAWGLGIDTVEERVFYSQPRIERLRCKSYLPEFDRSHVGPVSWRNVASLHGSMRNMRAATRAIRPHYRSISRMLATSDPTRSVVAPKGSPAEVALKWDQFHDAIEQLRLISDDTEFWNSGYLSSFSGLLTPTERLTIPGEMSSRVYWGSDATPEVLMVVDHLALEVAILVWSDELETLLRDALVRSGVPPDGLGDAIISVKELAAPVLGTCLWAHKYPDRLIICPVDNQTACAWIAKLEADNFFATGLLNVLARQMLRSHTEVAAPYINTERNTFADTPTRAEKLLPEARQAGASMADAMEAYVAWIDEQHPGYKVIDMAAMARHVFGNISARTVVTLPGGEPESQEFAAARARSSATLLVPPSDAGAPDDGHHGASVTGTDEHAGDDIVMIEGCAGCGQVSASAIKAGATVLKGIELDETPRFVYSLRFGADAPLDHDVSVASTWSGVAPADKRAVTCIFGGWPCPSFSKANPLARGGGDVRAWLLHGVLEDVLSDPDYNYQRDGNLLVLAGENVIGKEEWNDGEVIAAEVEVALSWGYVRHSIQLLGTHLGDGQARLRLVEWYEPWQLARWMKPLAAPRATAAPQRLCDLVRRPELREANLWVDRWSEQSLFERDDGPPTDGSRPQRAGFLTIMGRRHHVWHDLGPGWTVKASGEPPKLSGGAFYLCSVTGRVYILGADDTWALQGIPVGLLSEWRRRAGEPGVPLPTEAAVRRVAGNAITGGTAEFIAKELLVGRPRLWQAAVRQNADWAVKCDRPTPTAAHDDHYGQAPTPRPVTTRDGDAWRGGAGARVARRGVHHLLVGWFASLAALVAAPTAFAEQRVGSLESFALRESCSVLESYVEAKCGMAFDPHALRHTAAGGAWPAGVPPPRATASRKQLWTGAYALQLPKIVDYLVLGGLTLNTSNKYAAAMDQWMSFTANLNRDGTEQFPVLLTGENPERDERHLLEFVCYQGWLMGNKPSTIRGKLTGIRWHHLNNGLKNPCDGKFRLANVIKSLKRIRGESTGKWPVTPSQLRHLRARLDFTNPRHVVAWAGVTSGFFLCMRTSEYLAEGYTFDPTRSLTTEKVVPHLGDTILSAADFELADSITVVFELSKTDQNRVGCSRTVYSTFDDLCPVEAYKQLRRLRGSNWSGADAAMGDGTGWVMNREVMSAILKATAVDLALDGADFATHSLRIGGATTMAATGLYTDDEIRRFGRWKSDCWRRYVYSARECVRGLAAAMSRVHVVPEDAAQRILAPAAAA